MTTVEEFLHYIELNLCHKVISKRNPKDLKLKKKIGTCSHFLKKVIFSQVVGWWNKNTL